MTRREKNRLLQEEAQRQQQAEKDAKTSRRVKHILLAAYAAAGVAVGVLLLVCTAYGVLTAEHLLHMALYPAVAAALLFTLLYGIGFGVLHNIAATRPQKKKLARLATGTALATALLTMVVCIVFDIF